jgi:hypothetical protein
MAGLLDLPKPQVMQTPGAAPYFFIAPIDAFALPPAPASTGTDAQKVTVITPPTFKTGECWSRVEITAETGVFDDKGKTDGDSTTFTNSYKCFVPCAGADRLAFIKKTRGKHFVLLVPGKCDGEWVVVGCDCSPTICKDPEITHTPKIGLNLNFESVGEMHNIWNAGSPQVTPQA